MPRAIAPHAMHARRRIAREFDPLRIQRMELRMNHRARKRHIVPAALPSKRPATRPHSSPLECRGQPFAIGADGAFAELGAGAIQRWSLRERLPVHRPQAAAAREDNLLVHPDAAPRRRDGSPRPLVSCRVSRAYPARSRRSAATRYGTK